MELASLFPTSVFTFACYRTFAFGFRAVAGEINALFIPTAKVVHEDWDLQLRRSNPHVFCKLQTFACMNNAPGARMTRDRLREPCYAEG